jgi:hypothetical protein
MRALLMRISMDGVTRRMDTLRWMRSVVALQTCIALLIAFFVAPFQHVHAGHGSGSDNDHSGLIHSHFYPSNSVGRPVGGQSGPRLVDADDDDHATARSLDTFTLVLTSSPGPFVPTRGPALLFDPSETFQPVAVVEECGHDPPLADRSIPRAPPA